MRGGREGEKGEKEGKERREREKQRECEGEGERWKRGGAGMGGDAMR